MPEIMNPLRSAQKSRSINHVRAAVEYRLKQVSVVFWVVLKVRILHQDYVACCAFESAPERCSLAVVLFLKNKANVLERQQRVSVLHRNFARARSLSSCEIMQEL